MNSFPNTNVNLFFFYFKIVYVSHKFVIEMSNLRIVLICDVDIQTAVVAKEALEGHCIYDGGFCKLHLSYSRHTDLSIKVIIVSQKPWEMLRLL